MTTKKDCHAVHVGYLATLDMAHKHRTTTTTPINSINAVGNELSPSCVRARARRSLAAH